MCAGDPAHPAHVGGGAARAAAGRVRAAAHREAGARAPRSRAQGAPGAPAAGGTALRVARPLLMEKLDLRCEIHER